MKIINPKSKKKSKPSSPWYRLRFVFPSTQDCNETALSMAALLREVFPCVYFARYTGALDSYVDIVVNAVGKTLLTQADINSIMSKGNCRWTRIEGPEPCEGNRAHAAMFDFVLQFEGLAQVMKLDPEAKHNLWLDTLHWGHNMVGYDYVDEARCHLHSLDKLIMVFERSIKLGNRMAAAQKKAMRRQRKLNLN